MKVYLSGPITGTTDYMKHFGEDQKILETLGHTVINPALVNSNLPKDTTHGEYMRMSFCMLDMCDAICMLPGYKKSVGARHELFKAKLKGLTEIYIHGVR